MTFSDKWLTDVRTAIGGLRGWGAPDSRGVRMPCLTGLDTIGVLGQLSPSVVSAVRTFQRQVNGNDLANFVVESSEVGSDGHPDTGTGHQILDGITGSNAFVAWQARVGRLEITQYVAGYGYAPHAYKRSVIPGTSTFEPFYVSRLIVSDEDQLYSFVRGLMADWQRAIDASAAAIQSVSNDTAGLIGPAQLRTFWGCITSLCSSLDTLEENPPVTDSEKLKGAALDALHKTEAWAGQVAADLANEVGKAAGAVTKGFFSGAGALSLVVAGLAVWLFVR